MNADKFSARVVEWCQKLKSRFERTQIEVAHATETVEGCNISVASIPEAPGKCIGYIESRRTGSEFEVRAMVVFDEPRDMRTMPRTIRMAQLACERGTPVISIADTKQTHGLN